MEVPGMRQDLQPRLVFGIYYAKGQLVMIAPKTHEMTDASLAQGLMQRRDLPFACQIIKVPDTLAST